MKIAIPYDLNRWLVPLDMAVYIGILDTDSKKVEELESLGFGSKEATIQYIMRLGADAVAVKKGFLCPGSYAMSQGVLKYIPVNAKTVDDAINELPRAEAKDELEYEMFEENE
jgi:hypothetical protein